MRQYFSYASASRSAPAPLPFTTITGIRGGIVRAACICLIDRSPPATNTIRVEIPSEIKRRIVGHARDYEAIYRKKEIQTPRTKRLIHRCIDLKAMFKLYRINFGARPVIDLVQIFLLRSVDAQTDVCNCTRNEPFSIPKNDQFSMS